MPDLVEEVLHHGLGQVQPSVLEEAERLEVAVPSVELVEASAGHDEGQPVQPAALVRPEGQAQEARLAVDREHVFGGDALGQADDLQAQLGPLTGDLLEVGQRLRVRGGNVEARAGAAGLACPPGCAPAPRRRCAA